MEQLPMWIAIALAVPVCVALVLRRHDRPSRVLEAVLAVGVGAAAIAAAVAMPEQAWRAGVIAALIAVWAVALLAVGALVEAGLARLPGSGRRHRSPVSAPAARGRQRGGARVASAAPPAR